MSKGVNDTGFYFGVLDDSMTFICFPRIVLPALLLCYLIVHKQNVSGTGHESHPAVLVM